ncbi:hypothetical protein [Sphingomonas pokkalii]|uniref:Uncharacterized protein n=1 Tax=Sphingomonas pokkalii TaxID=2175090 RepID=A0A2U0SI03_9SPHN|nr:hypothetical protein [Sphingomonas pokkalii]PVX30966.1 hypothetical protein DD559_17870 [Sphingomonas pokkalii]
MPLTLTVTNAGRAAIVNASRDGTSAVRIAAIGVSATAITASAATTTLPDETKRISTIAGDAVAADTIHVTVRDESSSVYSVRSIALYLADGTLFAAYGQSSILVEKSAQAMLLLALDIRFTDIAASALTFGATNFLNPAATTETAGVVELATDAETATGTEDRRAVTPKGLSFSIAARLASWGADIWRASNDGAGSGLDADLLDGQQGSYYANIPARLGYTPANRAGDNFTGAITVTTGGEAVNRMIAGAGSYYGGFSIERPSGRRWLFGMSGAQAESGGNSASDFFINRYADDGAFIDTPFQITRNTGEVRAQANRVWHAGNDGAGSGLDADLLDGRDSSYYGDVVGRLGYTPANRTGEDFTGPVAAATPNTGTSGGFRLKANATSGFAYFQVTNPDATSEWGNLQFTAAGQMRWSGSLLVAGNASRNGALLWDAANDGAGSGLDADLLDGQQGSYYTNIAARLGYTPANRAGDSFTGSLIVSTGGEAVNRMIAGAGSYYGGFSIERPSGRRWLLGMSGAQDESGGNNASDFFINRYADDGAFIDTPFQIARNTGEARLQGGRAWHAGNDGAGSGLDADLLDGRDSSYYADIVARLGYTPARRTGEDFTGPVTAATPNAGSSGGFRLKGNATSGFAYFQVTNPDLSNEWGHFQFSPAGQMRWSGSLLVAGEASRNGARIWDAANDGAGSGLDADLLDGYDGAAYDRVVDQNLSENGGWLLYASGRKETWGWVQVPQDSFASYPLPIAHSEWVHPSLGVSALSGNRDNYQNTGIADIIGSPPTSIQIWNADDRTARVWVRTIGK